MNGEQRRKKILKYLKEAKKPISGSWFAKTLQVSRQVIVQDVALLRASGENVVPTAKGYILGEKTSIYTVERVFQVRHQGDGVEEELCIIVDNSRMGKDVVITHEVYGEMKGLLSLKTRRDVKLFLEKLASEQTLLSQIGRAHV